MPDVICNTSPLQYLHQINQIDLLPGLYSNIQVPQAVADEIATGQRNNNALPYLTDLSWATIRPKEEYVPLSQAPAGLGIGEKHVISLGLKSPDSLVVLDDRIARQYAVKADLIITGTVGILLEAKHRSLIPSVKPSLDHLMDLGFRISTDVYRKGLLLAGETIQ